MLEPFSAALRSRFYQDKLRHQQSRKLPPAATLTAPPSFLLPLLPLIASSIVLLQGHGPCLLSIMDQRPKS